MIIFGVQGIIFPLELFPRFILHRASPPFCSRYIFSSPLLVQLAVQGRNLLETSFLSTSSPLHLPFNLFLRLFLRLRFRSSRPSSSSWIFSPDLFLVHSNFFFDLIPSSFSFSICLSHLFPNFFLRILPFFFHLSVFSLFTFNYFSLQELHIFFSYVFPSVFLFFKIFFNFVMLILFYCYKFYVFLSLMILVFFFSTFSQVLSIENFVCLIPSCYLTFTSFFSAFPLWSVVPSRLRNHI